MERKRKNNTEKTEDDKAGEGKWRGKVNRERRIEIEVAKEEENEKTNENEVKFSEE